MMEEENLEELNDDIDNIINSYDTIRLDDVPMRISVEVGSTEISLKELKKIGEGSIIEFDDIVGRPYVVKCNGNPIALGELVVVDDNFAVRILELLSEEKQREYWRKKDIVPYQQIKK